MAEHSHAERMQRRIELSAEELSMLLGPERFAPMDPLPEEAEAPVATAAPAAPATEPSLTIDHPLTDSAPPGPAEAIAPPTGNARAIGDTDLVQAVIDGAPNFEQLALRAIRERTGEDLARIVAGSAADAMVASGTGTAIGGGRAFVAPLSPDARNAWALWLRRWCELAALAAEHAPKGLWDDATGFPSWPRMRPQVAHRIAAARLRRETVFVSVMRIEDAELWNRRSQVLVDRPFLARAAAALDAAVVPGDELARLDDGAFAIVSLREGAAAEIAAALRAEIARLPGDGPRSLAVHLGTAAAPWDAVDPEALAEIASRRAAGSGGR